MFKRCFCRLSPPLLALLLAGCAVGPDYHAPQPAMPPGWQATLPHAGNTQQLLAWWQQAGDRVLTQLIATAEADSPTLDQAWANIENARATLASDNAALWPQISGNASVTRAGDKRSEAVPASTNRSVGADASWELDLFGKIKRNQQAANARITARVADWHDARISLAAEVATDYVDYRACQLQVDVYARSVKSYQETVRLTGVNTAAGLQPPSELAQARANAAAVSIALTSTRASCDLTVKSLVRLTGMDEPQLRTLLGAAPDALPALGEVAVNSVPAQLLQQRPDLASAERELAAASAEIGAAQAAKYPDLTLTGSISLSSLLQAGTRSTLLPWSIAPALTLPLIDGGANDAAERAAIARYNLALASWRGKVRSAVQEVEQAMVKLNSAALQQNDYAVSVQGYQDYEDAATTNNKAGLGSALTLELARRDTLNARVNLIGVQRDRIEDWIALYKALGGGWTADSEATAPTHNTVTPGAAL
ncbi:efflux transporter outer membrane subunit [Silvimonas sp. JCM 19000]